MSAVFKNHKKKLSQTELRKLMSEHKNKQKNPKKIDSPLAKYNEYGQLICILCNSVVRSEAVWPIHINAKIHKQNVEAAKQIKEKTNNFTSPLKRPFSCSDENSPKKKIKSILKNASLNKDIYKPSNIINNLTDTLPDKEEGSQKILNSKQPFGDEFEVMETNDTWESTDMIPEGFFDDPKLDAKARNQEYKDPVEAEWEKFVKAIKEADSESNAIIAEDQEDATTERQIVEIDEQMKKLSRVLDLERKKVEIVSVSKEAKNNEVNEGEQEEEADGNFDEFLDWRSKTSV